VQRGTAGLAGWLLQVLTSVGTEPADVLEVRDCVGLWDCVAPSHLPLQLCVHTV
jgi:hypothetical protein